MDPLLIHTTHSTKFLLPLIVKNGITYKDIQSKLYNVYIADNNFPEYDQHLFVVIDSDFDYEFELGRYINEDFIYAYSDPDYDGMRNIYIYDIPEDKMDDYFNFLQGNYKQFSEDTKQKILKFWDVNKDSPLYIILYGSIKDDLKFKNKYLNKDGPFKRIYQKVYETRSYNAPRLENEIYGIEELSSYS